jgi:hypothetical protein
MAETSVRPKSGGRKDISGQRFGRLVAMSRIETLGPSIWSCICDCGTSKVARAQHLLRGSTKSCGCLAKEMLSARGRSQATHGASRRRAVTPEFKVWISMRSRCLHKKATGYKDYGGRGITICPAWLDSFTTFLSDMGPRPSSAYSIERINHNGNYEPSNCKWATKEEQAVNRRDNRLLTFQGRTMIAAQWAREMGLPINRIFARLRLGWSVEKALTAPIDARCSRAGLASSRARWGSKSINPLLL